MEHIARLEISDGLSYFVPYLIVLAVQCIHLKNYVPNAFVASTLTDKAIDVIQNQRSRTANGKVPGGVGTIDFHEKLPFKDSCIR
jgi:hypothetical protein